ncbi:MAG: hypothetical protein IJ563_00585 [Selenomonadaceae bacterium]|nr:hypothetical protein [Selenomonadaceae bacterium]
MEVRQTTYTLTINGQNYRYFPSRRINGKIKTVTIKRDSLGDIYVYFVTDATDYKVVERTGFFSWLQSLSFVQLISITKATSIPNQK